MVFRALLLLGLAIALSVAATLYFGRDVVVALGLILLQIKVILGKLAAIKLPAVLAWIKAQATEFFRIELLKKWISTSLIPLLLGSALLRRIASFQARYVQMVRDLHGRLVRWYQGLRPSVKVIAALIILAITLAVSVSSLGLWLILFSVKLPLWIGAALAALGRMLLASLEKSTFKAIAFLQLNWLWRGLKRVLPASWLERKRRFDFRMARAIVRRRRMTVQQLAERKDTLPFRIGFLIDYLRARDPDKRDDAG